MYGERGENLLERLLKEENYSRVIQEAELQLQKTINLKEYAGLKKIMGEANFFLAQYDGALFHLLDGLVVAQEVGESELQIDIYHLLAPVYGRLGEIDKVIEYAKLAIEGYSEKNNLKGMIRAYNNLGSGYIENQELDKAKECFLKGLEHKETVNEYIIAALYMNLATVYIYEKNFKQALPLLEIGLEMGEKIDNKHTIGYAYKMLSEVYEKLENYYQAEKYMKEALKIERLVKNKYEISECYESLSRLYEIQGDYKNAFEYYRSYSQLIRKIEGQNKRETLNRVEEEYELRIKELEHRRQAEKYKRS